MSADNIALIKRNSGEIVVVIDHAIEDWGGGITKEARILLVGNKIQIERHGDIIGTSGAVYGKLIEALAQQEEAAVIMMPDSDSFPILNVCQVERSF